MTMPHGLDVGERIPSFQARDQYGRLQSFETIRGSGGAFIVFIRSADW